MRWSWTAASLTQTRPLWSYRHVVFTDVCVEVVEQQAAILNPLYLLEKHSSWYAIQKNQRGESWSFEGFSSWFITARFPAFCNLNDTFKSVLLQKELESLGVNTAWKMSVWNNTSWNVSCPDSNRLPFAPSLHSLYLSAMAAIEATLDWDWGLHWTWLNLSQQSSALLIFK